MTSMAAALVKEGTTELFVFQKKTSLKGPSVRGHSPFYNPSMELNRDLSILVNQWFLNTTPKHVFILDGLAASGIRGIRFAHELTGDFEVTVNDWDDQAFALMEHNIQKLSLQNISAVNGSLHCLLSASRFHSIDIDPFGSPVYFFDSAIRSVYNNGLIACTATDTATLCGVFPSACYRRYAAWPLHGPSMVEIGMRILLGCICREAAKYGRGIDPLLCYTTDHYIRLYVQIHTGKKAADTSMAQYASISATAVPLSRGTSMIVGPLWLGHLEKKSVVQEIRALVSTKELHSKPLLWRLLDLLEEEAAAPPFFYTTNDLASSLKKSPPSLKHLFDYIHNKGFIVTRTHCTSTGFKTTAPLDVITEVFK